LITPRQGGAVGVERRQSMSSLVSSSQRGRAPPLKGNEGAIRYNFVFGQRAE
jgi:hypothetical protein